MSSFYGIDFPALYGLMRHSIMPVMKLGYRDIEPFVRKPDPKARVILVYGPDAGLVKERAAIMGKTVVADLNDPFNAVTLAGDGLSNDPARLNDEANAMSMLGGNRLIRVEGADDGLTPLIKDYLQNPSPHNLIILESGNLGAKSPLRALCEKSDHAASLPCYVDEGRDLATLIRDTLRQNGYGIEPDALSWLAANIAGDRQRVRSELDKIVLYMGPISAEALNQQRPPITLSDIILCCGEAGAEGLDDLANAIASSQAEQALRCYNRLLQEGVAAVAMLRTIQSHFRRLHITLARIEQGFNVDEAMRKLTPAVFFKQQDSFKAQLRRWTSGQIEILMQKLAALEAQTKQTGTPVETLCGQAILSISRAR